MSRDNTTCLIPTHNRPGFLRRIFKFYSQFQPTFRLKVIDSGHRESAEEHRSIVNTWKSRLDVEYEFYDTNFVDKCALGLQGTTTPFVVLCAHDDLLFPEAISKCVEFLTDHPSYTSAIGRTAEMNPERPEWLCQLLRAYPVEDDSPLDRCRKIADVWFNNFYAVFRTDHLRDIFRITAESTDYAFDFNLHEYMLSQLNALRGRIKVLPILYQLQTRHGANASSAQRVGPRPESGNHYKRFRDCLVEQFRLAGVDHNTSLRLIDGAYGHFQAPTWESRVPAKSPAMIMRKIRHLIDGVHEKWLRPSRSGFNRHRRLIRESDLAHSRPIWDAAVELVKKYPHGVAESE